MESAAICRSSETTQSVTVPRSFSAISRWTTPKSWSRSSQYRRYPVRMRTASSERAGRRSGGDVTPSDLSTPPWERSSMSSQPSGRAANATGPPRRSKTSGSSSRPSSREGGSGAGKSSSTGIGRWPRSWQRTSSSSTQRPAVARAREMRRRRRPLSSKRRSMLPESRARRLESSASSPHGGDTVSGPPYPSRKAKSIPGQVRAATAWIRVPTYPVRGYARQGPGRAECALQRWSARSWHAPPLRRERMNSKLPRAKNSVSGTSRSRPPFSAAATRGSAKQQSPQPGKQEYLSPLSGEVSRSRWD